MAPRWKLEASPAAFESALFSPFYGQFRRNIREILAGWTVRVAFVAKEEKKKKKKRTEEIRLSSTRVKEFVTNVANNWAIRPFCRKLDHADRNEIVVSFLFVRNDQLRCKYSTRNCRYWIIVFILWRVPCYVHYNHTSKQLVYLLEIQTDFSLCYNYLH